VEEAHSAVDGEGARVNSDSEKGCRLAVVQRGDAHDDGARLRRVRRGGGKEGEEVLKRAGTCLKREART
jgi:hypothetical protein